MITEVSHVSSVAQSLELPSQRPAITRDQFAPTENGEFIFNTILFVHTIMDQHTNGEIVLPENLEMARQNLCGYTDENRKKCSQLPTMSVDFDVIGDDDFILVCTNEHWGFVRMSIERELLAQGRGIPLSERMDLAELKKLEGPEISLSVLLDFFFFSLLP